MRISFLGQGVIEESQFIGDILKESFNNKNYYLFIGFVAFISQSGVKTIRKNITAFCKQDNVNFYVGIDQMGTSKEGLEELVSTGANVFIYLTKQNVTYHPKIYLFLGDTVGRLIIGSSNLTTRGLFSNIESSLMVELSLLREEDKQLISEIIRNYNPILASKNPNILKLDYNLIDKLYKENRIPSERNKNYNEDDEITELPPDELISETDENSLNDEIGIDEDYDEQEDELNNLEEESRSINCIAAVLLEHPDGLYFEDIVKNVHEIREYSDKTIQHVLYCNDFFEKQSARGLWKINLFKWKIYKNKYEESISELMPMDKVFKSLAYVAKTNRKILTNYDFQTMTKESFILSAWKYYMNTIYKRAKKRSSYSITIEDNCQIAFFAIIKAYKKYNSSSGNSFNRYFSSWLTSQLLIEENNYKKLVRIPTNRHEQLNKLEKTIYESLFFNGYLIDIKDDFFDYTLWKIDYIGFPELFAYDSLDFIDNDKVRSYCYSLFNDQREFENNTEPIDVNEFENVYEPLQTRFEELLIYDYYPKLEQDIINDVFLYIDNKTKKKKIKRSDVLKYRAGLHESDPGKIFTLEEIGSKFGITRERVRQIETEALNIAKDYLITYC